MYLFALLSFQTFFHSFIHLISLPYEMKIHMHNSGVWKETESMLILYIYMYTYLLCLYFVSFLPKYIIQKAKITTTPLLVQCRE